MKQFPDERSRAIGSKLDGDDEEKAIRVQVNSYGDRRKQNENRSKRMTEDNWRCKEIRKVDEITAATMKSITKANHFIIRSNHIIERYTLPPRGA